MPFLTGDKLPTLATEAAPAPEEAGSDKTPAALKRKWKTKAGQLWQITGEQTHRLLIGDAGVQRGVRGSGADSVATSDSGWTDQGLVADPDGSGLSYQLYDNAATQTQLFVQTGIDQAGIQL